MTEEQRRRMIRERKRRKRRRRKIRRMMILSGMFILLVLVFMILIFIVRSIIHAVSGNKNEKQVVTVESEISETKDDESSKKETKADARQDIIDSATLTAAGYDYEGAIDELETIDGYEEDTEITEMISDYQEANDAMVPVDMYSITHIFYHSLVVDTDRAFVDTEEMDGFKQWMTTTYEFDQITQQMYDRGYVMISLNDMITRTTGDDGLVHIAVNQLYLPEGKTPFVLSLDDLCYYHSYDDKGTAARLVLDDEGKITCEYYDADGNLLYGDYDCVPRMNSFLEEHPDGAYHGARGTIALTGYDGIFGYRTDGAYTSIENENLDEDQKVYLEEHPDFDYDEECSEATVIANELKNEGWTLASHTWGHLNMSSVSMERLEADTTKFKTYVDPLIGGTDIIIFAHGADMAGVEEYDYNTNEKFHYLKDEGYNVYCNVDSNQYFIQYNDLYLRMGRRNLDGYRIWYDVYEGCDLMSDLCDPASVIDPARDDMPEL